MRLTSLTASRSSRIHASSETGLRRLRTCWQHGVAPHRRLLDAVHHRRLCRAHCVREVGVPVLTVVRTCRQLAVDRLVGQQHHLVMLRMAVERLAVVVVKLAEMPCECSQRFSGLSCWPGNTSTRCLVQAALICCTPRRSASWKVRHRDFCAQCETDGLDLDGRHLKSHVG